MAEIRYMLLLFVQLAGVLELFPSPIAVCSIPVSEMQLDTVTQSD